MSREQLLTVADESLWRSALPLRQSVFGSVEFARIATQLTGNPARLWTFCTNDAMVVYPFFLRSINALPFASHLPRPLWDIGTPEYTGPLAPFLSSQPSLPPEVASRFTAFCREAGIVTEFAHLHPWHARRELLDPRGVSLNREIVVVDLTLPEADLWEKSLSNSCRKNIRLSQQAQVRVFPGTTPDDVREFHRLYIHTMERNQALDRYFFPLTYFLDFFEQMPQNTRFALAEYQGRIVGASLYLYDDTDVYYYLSGADQAFPQVRATNAMLYDTILWAQAHGCQRLVLGGGYQPDDGVFRFKATFSPWRVPFYVYRQVHLGEEYRELADAWSACYGLPLPEEGYFPRYRATPVSA